MTLRSFSDFTVVAWNQPLWEHLHHRNQPALHIRALRPSPSSPAHHGLKCSKITAKKWSLKNSAEVRVFVKALREKASDRRGWSWGAREAAFRLPHVAYGAGAEATVFRGKCLSWPPGLLQTQSKNSIYFSSSLNIMFTWGTSMDSCILKCLSLIHIICLKSAMKLMIPLNPGYSGDLMKTYSWYNCFCNVLL